MDNFPKKIEQIKQLLLVLGFTANLGSGRGDHLKFVHKIRRPVVSNQRPFIMIPRHNFNHGKFHEIVKQELTKFGFTKEELKKAYSKIKS